MSTLENKLDMLLFRKTTVNGPLCVEPLGFAGNEFPQSLTDVNSLANSKATFKSYPLERSLDFCLVIYLFIYLSICDLYSLN